MDTPKVSDLEVEKLPRMIAIHASYCSVCKEMKPIVEKIKTQCDLDHVKIEAYDVSKEQHEHLLEDFKIKGLPTYVFVDEAEYEVARLVGAQTESALKQALGVLRGEDCPGVGTVRKPNNT
jgi:thiol:disulfide interchange protein